MRAKFGRDPMAGSKKLTFKFISRYSHCSTFKIKCSSPKIFTFRSETDTKFWNKTKNGGCTKNWRSFLDLPARNWIQKNQVRIGWPADLNERMTSWPYGKWLVNKPQLNWLVMIEMPAAYSQLCTSEIPSCHDGGASVISSYFSPSSSCNKHTSYNSTQFVISRFTGAGICRYVWGFG